MALFPHKLAAVRAGLGWIGKSSLLITREHGPRVYLATVLVDCDIEPDRPVLESGCGGCTACVEACPYLCIKDLNWHSGTPREELLDVYLCNAKREEAIKSKGRKDECGQCLLACPYGKGA
ncbi:MAG: epoxyqueuosine reductase [Deltaproteobacteria bacterium]|uniref:Epoxyqueuosine reductase n=1 Tax=Candidatus Zymogenus saltonus TaxID=2844893 RepID=A0A9D8KDQ2_9DELT|nr:epoxyqueuosine reductase [Candidatus Zymogenus saltonus]